MIKDWNADDFFFGEDDFAQRMDTVVKEWRQEQVKEDYFTSFDGTKIHYHYAIHPQERAAIVISHGFCEFFGKYHEMMYYFYEAGYSVFFPEHRGHGFSERKVTELDKVYVRSYDEYVGDMKEFMDQVVTTCSISHRYILYAHSMGGAIGTLFLEFYPTYFERAVLSSPMHEMDFRKVPNWQVMLLMIASRFLPWEERYVPGQRGFDHVYAFATSSCQSEPRYAYVFRQRQEVPEYTSYGGTYAWTRASIKGCRKLRKNARKVQIPVLLFQAGRDTMVKPAGQDLFAKNSGNTKLVCFPESKHEIFNSTEEIRKKYYRRIFGFLEKDI